MQIGKYKVRELEATDKIFTDDITRNRDWYEKSWAGFLAPFYIVGFGVSINIKRNKNVFGFAINFFKDDKINWFYDSRDLRRVRDRVLKNYISSQKEVSDWIKAWNKDWQNFLKNVHALEKIDISKLSDKSLWEWYKKITDSYAITNSLPYITDTFLSTGEEDWLVGIIKKELKDKVADKEISEVIGKLTLATKNSFSQSEHINLLYIASQIFKIKELRHCSADVLLLKLEKYPKLLKLLQKHAKDFYWIENGYYHAPRLTEKYFLEKICKLYGQDVGELYKKEVNQSKANKIEKEKIYKKLKISTNTKKIIKLSEIFSKWQDTRKSAVFKANYFIFQVLDETSKRNDIAKEEVYYMIRSDIKNALLYKKFDLVKLRDRRKIGCALVFTTKGVAFFDSHDFGKINKDIFFEKHADVNELKGAPASSGNVRGIVRVIFKPTDFINLKKGEILVTNNTTPDFVPIMKIAGAILTEQGGITSHAAVVSRELKIPCVIGIKSVTKILKDGDMVEVDANKGIVKIIK